MPRDEFVLNANEKQSGAFERQLSKCALFGAVGEAVQPIEYLVAKRLTVPDCCTKQAQVFPHSPALKS